MEFGQVLLWAVLGFFCLWSALLARLKGYSAICWLLGGGVIGVVLLCQLSPASVGRRQDKIRGNLLGLSISVLTIFAGWWFRELL